jgi:hypothetical protein
MRCGNAFSLEDFSGKGHLGDLGVYGRITLKWILKKECMRLMNEFT